MSSDIGIEIVECYFVKHLGSICKIKRHSRGSLRENRPPYKKEVGEKYLGVRTDEGRRRGIT